MPAVYTPPASGSGVFQYSTQPDQVAVNAAPRSDSTFYISPSPHTSFAEYSLTHVLQTDRDYSGADTVRNIRGGCRTDIRVDNNDPTYTPVNIIACGFRSNIYSGFSGPSVGTPINFIAQHFVQQVPSPHSNEYSCFFASLNAGTRDAPISGGNYWFFDHAMFGPIGGQPGILSGYSLVTNNYYNGSPQFGAAVGICLQTAPKIGGANNLTCTGGVNTGASATTYPWDVGYFISGYSTGGTGDGYTNAIQVGGLPGPWMGTGSTNYGGDVGQVARGVVVKVRNDGNPVSRLGAFVSEGQGERGGLVLGLDTNDASRVSLYRSANGAATLNGNLAVTGTLSSVYGSGRKLLVAVITPGTPVTATSLTSIFTGATLAGSLTIPANTLQVGSMLRLELFGTFGSSASTPNLTLQLSLGGTIIGQGQSGGFVAATGNVWTFDHVAGPGFMCQAIGASGKIIGSDRFNASGGSTAVLNASGTSNLAPAQVTVGTNAALVIDIKAAWSAAIAANTITLLGGAIYLDG